MDETQSRREWASAFQRASWGCAPAIGRELGMSPRTIQQWGHAEDHKRSPGERLEVVMRVALEKRKPHDALAPLHLLAERFGYRLVPRTPETAENEPLPSLPQQASQAMIEAGEAVNTVLAAIEDDIISADEMDAIDRECDEAIEALSRLKLIARRDR